MVRELTLTALLAAIILLNFGPGDICRADPPFPQAPANVSWLPHGYGGNMTVYNTNCANQKGLHGFRPSPEYIGCWSQPLWGWDINGYYLGPQVPCPDPGMCQLPIGLIYPANGPMLPPDPPVRKVSR
ncbi:MAG: hypothetical protein WBG50_19835 [Desulfomonilaceae bacterium]